MGNFHRNILHTVAAALLPVLSTSSLAPAQAAIVPARVTSVTVRFHSGDLDTPQGVARLYRRIRVAAGSVCGQPDDVIPLDKLIWSQCVDQAIAAAVASIHSYSLSAYRGSQLRGRKRLEASETLAVRELAAP